MNIELPEEFIKILNNYHKDFIIQQMNKIDNTLKIISIEKVMINQLVTKLI